MEFVAGGSLDKLIKSGAPLKPENALGIVRQVAAALDEAHANGADFTGISSQATSS